VRWRRPCSPDRDPRPAVTGEDLGVRGVLREERHPDPRRAPNSSAATATSGEAE
jgi:hypothetical protein